MVLQPAVQECGYSTIILHIECQHPMHYRGESPTNWQTILNTRVYRMAKGKVG